jgi:hypothetical protein
MKVLILAFNEYHSLTIEQRELIKELNDIDNILIDYDFNKFEVNEFTSTVIDLGYPMLNLILDYDMEFNTDLIYCLIEVGHMSEITPFIFKRYFGNGNNYSIGNHRMERDIPCMMISDDFEVNHTKTPPNGRSQNQHNRIQSLNKTKRY